MSKLKMFCEGASQFFMQYPLRVSLHEPSPRLRGDIKSAHLLTILSSPHPVRLTPLSLARRGEGGEVFAVTNHPDFISGLFEKMGCSLLQTDKSATTDFITVQAIAALQLCELEILYL